MSELISISAFNKLSVSQTNDTVNAILELNGELGEYGLTITPAQAVELADTRQRALADSERIELSGLTGGGAVVKLMKKFSTSSYVDQSNFAQILNELTELFYYIKSETMDKVNDEVLIDTLFECFETTCNGDVSLLGTREMPSILRSFRIGKLKNRNAQYHRDEYAPYRPEKDDDYSDMSEPDDDY